MKTTKADFDLFQKYCNEAIEKLGLVEWSVHYDHDKLDDAYARTYWHLEGGVATIVFAKQWEKLRPKTDDAIRRVALHEVLHLVMAPLTGAARERYTTQDQIDTAEHLIIRRLENVCL